MENTRIYYLLLQVQNHSLKCRVTPGCPLASCPSQGPSPQKCSLFPDFFHPLTQHPQTPWAWAPNILSSMLRSADPFAHTWAGQKLPEAGLVQIEELQEASSFSTWVALYNEEWAIANVFKGTF